MNELSYCRNLIAYPGSDTYYSLRFSDTKHHPAILGVLSFYHEIFNIIFDCQDEAVAQQKINWWLDEATKLHNNTANHPILKLLGQVKQNASLNITHLLQLGNNITDDLANFSFNTFEDLTKHIQRTFGIREMLILEAITGNDHYQTENTLALSTSLGLATIMQNFYFYKQKGLIPIAQHDINAFDLGGIFSDEKIDLAKLLQKYHLTAQQIFDTTLEKIADEKPFKNLIIRTALALKACDAIAKDNYRVMEHQVKLTPLKKLWFSWKLN